VPVGVCVLWVLLALQLPPPLQEKAKLASLGMAEALVRQAIGELMKTAYMKVDEQMDVIELTAKHKAQEVEEMALAKKREMEAKMTGAAAEIDPTKVAFDNPMASEFSAVSSGGKGVKMTNALFGADDSDDDNDFGASFDNDTSPRGNSMEME
jgi:hypothetical protein